MKNVPQFLLLCIICIMLVSPVYAQTRGSIAFIGFNSTNPDEFTFITLEALPTGSQISFTDIGWDGSGLNLNEGVLLWTATSDIPANTIISVSYKNDLTVSNGNILSSGSFSLSTSGDQILAFTGTVSSPYFIAAVNFNGSSWTSSGTIDSNDSYLPPGLTNGNNALSLDETDNAVFIGDVSSGLTTFNNAANWHSMNHKQVFIASTFFPYNLFIGTGTSWDNTTYWYTGQLPDSDESIIVPNGKLAKVNMNNAQCKNLIIEYNGELTINASQSLTVSNKLYMQSYTSDNPTYYAGSLVNEGTLGFSSIHIERDIPDIDWHIISSPVPDVPMSIFSSLVDKYPQDPPNTFDFGPYDENLQNWNYLSDLDENLEIGEGYLMRLGKNTDAQAITYSGSSVNFTTVTHAIYQQKNGWNSTGNPFPSSLKIKGNDNSGFLYANLDQLHSSYAGIYLWSNADGDYVVISNTLYDPPNNGATGPLGGEEELSQDNIALGQGFVVKSKDNGGSLSFTPAMQIHGNTADFKSGEISWPGLTLTVKSKNNQNSTHIAFHKNMSYGLDPTFDVGKLKGNEELAVYSQLIDNSSEVEFYMQVLPDRNYKHLEIPVGMDSEGNTDLNFSIYSSDLPHDTEIYLEDKLNKTSIRLDGLDDGQTIFIAEALQGFGRFSLILKNKNGTEIITSTTNKHSPENNFKIYQNQSQLVISGKTDGNTTITLYNSDGRAICKSTATHSNKNIFPIHSISPGIYLLRIENQKPGKSYKIFIHPQN